jgi:hypothetical protein
MAVDITNSDSNINILNPIKKQRVGRNQPDVEYEEEKEL